MSNSSMPVMILAAGRGERMRPLTDITPKPLLDVAGQPLMAYHLQRLAAAGFTRVVVNVAYRGDQIENWLGDGSQYGLCVRYSREPEGALETGGGMRHALPLIGPGPFLVINGDVFTDYPFDELRQRGLAKNDLAHLVMVPNPDHKPGGDFALTDGRVQSEGEPRLTYSGIGLFRAALVAGDRPERFALAPLLIEAMQAGRVSGERYDGVWDDIGTPQRLQALAERLSNGRVAEAEAR